ncbi:MAG: hypothetical protein ACD_78C00199G0006 [uncultured bacterium (gcode 4)]|uniref:Uncharacterized protein n=1 Tax=uncultured bacterium (gcode 4) TaxID=1234023 RepID=K1YX74_9BACT|nr:MAG: hypothetical protein ACD_78C00199G0006 [uncultured bacterium (gcode 4)]
MTIPFPEDEEEDELLIDSALDWDEDDIETNELEITLDDVENIEEEENIGHKVQTFDPADDGVDNYFDERYFDE